jgi:hypothetical protein
MSILNSFMIEPKYAEKRDFVRMQIEMPIRITNTTTNETVTGMCKNLSGNGLKFASTMNFTIGAQLEITLDNNNDRFNKLDAVIQVVRSEQNHENHTFEIGAKIVKLIK